MTSKLQSAMELGFRPYILKKVLNGQVALIEPGASFVDEGPDSPGSVTTWWEKNAQRVLLEIEQMYKESDAPYIFKEFIVIHGNLIKRSNIVAMLRYEKESSFQDNKNRAFLTDTGKRDGAKSVIIMGTGAIIFTDIEYWLLSNYLI